MDAIILNKDKFTFEVSLNYGYVRGPGYVQNNFRVKGKDFDNTRSLVYAMPSVVKIHITCNNDRELFSMLKELVPKLEEDDVTIEIVEPKRVINKRVKDEYVKINDFKKLEDEERQKEAKLLLDKLQALDVKIYNVDIGQYRTPEEYTEVESEFVSYEKAGISVLCHSETNFYQVIYQSGILEECLPAWYKEGKF